ncbi:class I SAM-dependent methyltransferase [Rhodococcus sp. NPDC047139]|uniref:class I SAM-dependent methyltransferase n=1 Tax=Rhodococcus sp. NPDC047139 TaxID=3155141 RepID=UPI0033CF2F17
MKCRLCNSDRLTSILDLGATPPCERFLTREELDLPECTYPLHLRLCEHCLLLQIPALITPEDTFTEYAYFSSYSQSWVDHARRFVHDALGSGRLRPDSTLIEVASNDGYLLRHAVDAGIRCLGIEPSVNVGEAAREAGVPTLTGFLDVELAEHIRSDHGPADLVVANNVYAHVPDLVGFTRALRLLMADDGWLSIEVHHALNLVSLGQFDTIYHEHFQYFTVLSAERALASGGLRIVDVELLDTHGGSIRLWARPEQVAKNRNPRVAEVLEIERRAGLHDPTGYFTLEPLARDSRLDLLRFLLQCRDEGLSVAGYGAPGKGNTLLNYCGIRPDLLPYTVDRNPYKYGRFTPGTRIPIEPVERIARDRPDIVLALPWNLEPELTRQLAYIEDWGGRLVFPLPTIHTTIGSPEMSWRATS